MYARMEPAVDIARPSPARAAQIIHDLRGGIDVLPIGWDEAGPTIPLILLPSQLRPDCKLCECGCQRLMLEVLIDAFDALQRPPPGRPFEFTRNETLAWFAAPDMDVTVNLRDCVEALGLDLRRVQRTARKLAAGRITLPAMGHGRYERCPRKTVGSPLHTAPRAPRPGAR
jgi:hypothetical protein